jgi:uncharacterized membrane protein YdfJ with MMPL/SSD domain
MQLLNASLKAMRGFQILSENFGEAAARQAQLLQRAAAEGRDLTDAELQEAKDWAATQKARRDALLAQDAADAA